MRIGPPTRNRSARRERLMTLLSPQFNVKSTTAATMPPPRVLSLLIIAFWTALPKMMIRTRS